MAEDARAFVRRSLQEILDGLTGQVRARQTALGQAHRTHEECQRQLQRALEAEERATDQDDQIQQQYAALRAYGQAIVPLPPYLDEKLTQLSAAQGETATKRTDAQTQVATARHTLEDAASRVRILQEKEARLQTQIHEVRERINQLAH